MHSCRIWLPNDEVIVPAQTHTATSHAVEFTGANAVFADVDPINGNISLDEIKEIQQQDKRRNTCSYGWCVLQYG